MLAGTAADDPEQQARIAALARDMPDAASVPVKSPLNEDGSPTLQLRTARVAKRVHSEADGQLRP